MDRLDGIEVYVKVVQCGSFSAAARVLGMPITTVSGKVASLEKRLGVTLIHRTTRKLNITEAGEAYFKHCLRALEEVGAAEKALSISKAEPEGLLRITAPPDVGHLILPPIIRTYLKKYPKVEVELLLSNRLVDLVAENVDLAVRAGALKDSTLMAKKFIELEVSLWASASYVKKNGLPRQPNDLLDHEVIAFKVFGETLKLNQERGGGKVSIPIRSRLKLDDIEAIKIFTMSGDGIGILSPLICQPEIASGKLVRVLPGWSLEFAFGQRGNLSFVYPPQRYVSPKIQAFIETALHGS